MNRSRRFTLVAFGIVLAVLAGMYLNQEELGTKVVNIGNKEYYQDKNGELWDSEKSYEEYDDTSYYIAPDGSYWMNEYRYLQSQG